MDYITKYINRLGGENQSFKDSFMNQSKEIIANQIINSPVSYKAYIDFSSAEYLDCITNDIDGYKVRKFIYVPNGTIHIGTYATVNNLIYLMTDRDTNEITPEFTGKLCTANFPVTTPPTKVQTGTDNRGRPIYTEIAGTTTLLPCVIKMNDASTAIAETNKPINLLDNQIMVTITYTEADSIQYNERFDMFGDTYRIIRINPSDSINGVGILHITGERLESVGDA